MNAYTQPKDIFTQRRNSNNSGFEEFPVIIAPNTILSINNTGDLSCVPISTLNVSSSYSLTASYALNGGGSGSGITLTTGSTYPITSSWANNVLSASYAISASYAPFSQSYQVSSSYALSASYAPFSQSYQVSSSYAGTSSLAAYSPVSRPDLNNGLILFMPLNEGVGTVLKDYSVTQAVGNYTSSNIGFTPLTNHWNTQSIVGGSSIQFNGTSSYSYVNVNNSTTLFNTSNKATVAIWFNITASIGNTQVLFAKYNANLVNTNTFILTIAGTSSISSTFYNTSNTPFQITQSNPINLYDNNWHLLSATYNGTSGTQSLYLDGKLVSTSTSVTGTLNPSNLATVTLGNYFITGTGSPYFGSLQNAKIWGRDLSPLENALLYQEFQNSFTSSYSISASYAPQTIPISASYASSSLNSISASYSLNAGTTLTTGSTYNITASWANSVISASYAKSASYAISASYAPFSQSYQVSSSYALTASALSSTASLYQQGYVWTGSYTNTQTGNYTLQSIDNSKFIIINATASVGITVPTGLPQGFACSLLQYGAGQIVVTGSSTILNRASKSGSYGQYSIISLIQVIPNTYILQGDVG